MAYIYLLSFFSIFFMWLYSIHWGLGVVTIPLKWGASNFGLSYREGGYQFGQLILVRYDMHSMLGIISRLDIRGQFGRHYPAIEGVSRWKCEGAGGGDGWASDSVGGWVGGGVFRRRRLSCFVRRAVQRRLPTSRHWFSRSSPFRCTSGCRGQCTCMCSRCISIVIVIVIVVVVVECLFVRARTNLWPPSSSKVLCRCLLSDFFRVNTCSKSVCANDDSVLQSFPKSGYFPLKKCPPLPSPHVSWMLGLVWSNLRVVCMLASRGWVFYFWMYVCTFWCMVCFL